MGAGDCWSDAPHWATGLTEMDKEVLEGKDKPSSKEVR